MWSLFCGYSRHLCFFLFFFFTATATTEIYTLSLHDALPILLSFDAAFDALDATSGPLVLVGHSHVALAISAQGGGVARSEEHTSELQSQSNLVCRLLLEKKKKKKKRIKHTREDRGVEATRHR